MPAHVLFLIIKSQPIISDDHITIQASGRILQIKAAQISDTGRYSCVASNIAGEDELEFDVNIQGTVACVSVCMFWADKGNQRMTSSVRLIEVKQ